MSQPSRASRRQSRGGVSAPPPRRDPMNAIYIAVAVLIVIVIAIFGFMNWQQNQQFLAAFMTPTPAPSGVPTARPVQLTDGETLGTPYFKLVGKDKIPVTAAGGHGQPVDGIACASQEYATLHIHSHLTILDNGKQIQIPRLIGASPSGQGGCLYWLHTHDQSGIIHVEAPQVESPQGGPYKLGMFFDEWGQPLTRTNVGGIQGPVTAFVNGSPYTGDLRAIPLAAHQQIVLEIGKVVTPPPNYIFPPGD